MFNLMTFGSTELWFAHQKDSGVFNNLLFLHRNSFSYFQPDRSAIVSLHGCGDLQTILLKLFTRLKKERVPLIFVVSCCYHKMSGIGDNLGFAFFWIVYL